jgi:hypothetical protein
LSQKVLFCLNIHLSHKTNKVAPIIIVSIMELFVGWLPLQQMVVTLNVVEPVV